MSAASARHEWLKGKIVGQPLVGLLAGVSNESSGIGISNVKEHRRNRRVVRRVQRAKVIAPRSCQMGCRNGGKSVRSIFGSGSEYYA